MARYLLIQSRDPYETREVAHDYELASSLVDEGGVTEAIDGIRFCRKR
jgi:hypothetical protein